MKSRDKYANFPKSFLTDIWIQLSLILRIDLLDRGHGDAREISLIIFFFFREGGGQIM